jgi:hypothetical protein
MLLHASYPAAGIENENSEHIRYQTSRFLRDSSEFSLFVPDFFKANSGRQFVNYDKICVEFFKMLLTKKDLLKKIHNSEKFSSFASYF